MHQGSNVKSYSVGDLAKSVQTIVGPCIAINSTVNLRKFQMSPKKHDNLNSSSHSFISSDEIVSALNTSINTLDKGLQTFSHPRANSFLKYILSDHDVPTTKI